MTPKRTSAAEATGAVAAIGAGALGAWGVMRFVMDVDYQFDLLSALAIVIGGVVAVLVTGLLFAGRAGSAITAEIGLMKASEQLSSMEMMGVDPLRRIVAPRLWAGLISMPLLTAIFNVVAIYGGVVVSIEWLGTDAGGFWSGMQDSVELWEDLGKGMVKSVIFALVITWIAVFQGYDTTPTAEGIGLATTRTVVISSVMVLAIDFVLTLSMYGDF